MIFTQKWEIVQFLPKSMKMCNFSLESKGSHPHTFSKALYKASEKWLTFFSGWHINISQNWFVGKHEAWKITELFCSLLLFVFNSDTSTFTSDSNWCLYLWQQKLKWSPKSSSFWYNWQGITPNECIHSNSSFLGFVEEKKKQF